MRTSTTGSAMKSSTRRQKTRRPPSGDDHDVPGDGTPASMRVPVSEVMTPSALCVPEQLSVTTLEEILLDRDLSGLPVVDDQGKLVGFVEMTDIVREVHHRPNPAEPPGARTVAQVMSPITLELTASCSVAKAIHLMATQHVHRLPVVAGDGALLGIVTSGDIVRYLAGADRTLLPARRPDRGAPEWEAAERERLTEADRVVALGFLAGGVAHQVNNALTPMRLSLGRLTSFELSQRPLSAERLHRIELLQDVREGVERIEHVIRELKAFSHTDGPNRTVDVPAELEVAIGLAAHEIRHRARLVCDYATVPTIRAKPAELRQVFLNLLVNAAQATPEGQAHVNEIRVMTRTDGRGRAVIEITDTGTGIPSDVATRIFEPFFTTRLEHTGLGLGLTLSRDIVAALDGEITIDSVVGKGTTVRIALPPGHEEPVSATRPSLSRSAPAARPERRRILIVDDDRPVAAALALELGVHDVVVAESGREALTILGQDKNFDMILCDLMMPEVSGIDVYETLRLLDPSLLDRMVMMTGGAFTPRARQFLAEIDTPLIEKPFYPGQLNELAQTLGRRRARATAQLLSSAQLDP